MKVQLYNNRTIQEEHIDIHYRQMSPLIKRVMAIAGNKETRTQIMAKSDVGKQMYINVDDILYFDSVDKKTFLYTSTDVHEFQDPLSDIEEYMAADGFIRINKSVIANIYHIESIKPEVNMRISAIMDNGEILMINRSYKKSFVKFLKERRGE